MRRSYVITAIILFINSLTYARAFIIGGKIDESKNENGVIQISLAFDKNSDLCTATKVSENFIITGAHCLGGYMGQNLNLGFSRASKNKEMEYSPLAVEEVYVHHKYASLNSEEAAEYESNFSRPDIALIKVIPSEEFKKLLIVKINFDYIEPGKKVELWGYGCQKDNNHIEDYTPFRKYGTSSTLDKNELNKGHQLMTDFYNYYSDSIYKVNFITVGKAKDNFAPSLCLGDSGGPTLLNGALVGINVNYTFNDMNPNDSKPHSSGVSYLNIHARVSEVKQWIEKTLRP